MATHGDLIERVKGLSLYDQENIFNIFKCYHVNFSRNANGVFINLKNVPTNVIEEIDKYIENSKERQSRLDQFEELASRSESQKTDRLVGHDSYDQQVAVRQLDSSITREIQSLMMDDDWSSLPMDDASLALFRSFVDQYETSLASVHKKQHSHIKFFNIKKAFMRSTASDASEYKATAGGCIAFLKKIDPLC
jgi:hypothetical protein